MGYLRSNRNICIPLGGAEHEKKHCLSVDDRLAAAGSRM